MTKANNIKTITTTFGTILAPINMQEGIFVLKNDHEATIDTPLGDSIGTKKTFLSGSVVNGTLWREADRKAGKTRKVVMVQDDNGRYLIPQGSLEPTTKTDLDLKDAKDQVEKLGGKIEEILDKAKNEAGEIIENPKSFLEKEYVGFTGKQILVASLGVIILIKLFNPK